MSPHNPVIEISNLARRYGRTDAVNGLSLRVQPGRCYGFFGRNGAGKTTLFGIASGTVKPDAGRVRFAENDVTELSTERRCRLGLARSFQIPQPFSGMSVFENVVVAAAFGAGEREAAVYDRCAELLGRCGLSEKANRRAGGLTLLDRKRLELARQANQSAGMRAAIDDLQTTLAAIRAQLAVCAGLGGEVHDHASPGRKPPQ